jgi:PEP-CTERM motif
MPMEILELRAGSPNARCRILDFYVVNVIDFPAKVWQKQGREEDQNRVKRFLGLGIIACLTGGSLLAGNAARSIPQGRPVPAAITRATDASLITTNAGPAAVRPVPEPSTVSLLAGAAILSSCFFLRRRRRQ